MPLNYCFIFSSVEISVRYGYGNTNNEDIISYYVHMGLERARKRSDIADVQHSHMRILNTLIDTMCDHCVTSVWRKQCYRYIKRLLPLLYEMLDYQQYKQKTQEIQRLHAYFLEDNENKYQLYSPQHSGLTSMKKQS
jgi:hypothetical protein